MLKTILAPTAAALVAAGVAAIAIATQIPSADSERPVRTACASGAELQTGLSAHRLETGGRERAYRLYVPHDHAGDAPIPLVVDLQASGVSPEIEFAISGLEDAAERNGFAVLLPEAVTPFPSGGHTWNVPASPDGPDDVAFIAAAIDDAAGRACVDETRVYAVGFSGGGRMASELACRTPERFAAIGAVGGLRHPGGARACRRADPAVSIIAFHSVDDPINPYRYEAGAAPPYWTHGVDEALSRWAATNGCAARPVVERASARAERIVYDDCRGGGRVVLHRLSGSGHVWPGSGFAFPERLGAPEPEIAATPMIVDFLSRYERRPER
ncbi:hypothetical protein DDZ18_02470 [Marinicauda salina]|uniref:Polyhydroxybutyrate depolymerase n=1 Tax=Marinicauda salina TaxID=2135793 RepID=A0A2U2BWY5_9PROT|nr:PHB depolymerase family esterase [Marinicauda salina]PWE18489.1 hypothetical protein DDZ18_02470 [Marinicauda salina]